MVITAVFHLIRIVVTASYIRGAGVEVERPGALTAAPREAARIVVAVTANDRIWIAGRQTDARAVRNAIERLHAGNPRGALVVQADARSSAKAVAAVLDAARAAGIEDVSLSTRRP